MEYLESTNAAHSCYCMHTYINFVAGSENSANFMVPSSDYLDHLTDQALLNVTVLALVEGTNQSWVGKKTAPLHKPSIPIMVTKAKTKKGIILYRIL